MFFTFSRMNQYFICLMLCTFAFLKAFPAVAVEGKVEKGQEDLDAYDPFTDYSEFENPESERKDILFFQTGRFLTLGFYGGWRDFTGEFRNYLHPNFSGGGFIGYFLSLRSSLQVSFLISHHHYVLSPEIIYRSSYHTVSFDFKYYFDKYKLINVLSFFNPHIILGPVAAIRPVVKHIQVTAGGESEEGAVQAPPIWGFGFKIGFGIEIMLTESMYLGLEGDFMFVEFADEQKLVGVPNKKETQHRLSGDLLNGLVVLGVNF